MPNLNNIFPSRYLKAHELQGKEPTVTIARVALERAYKSGDVLVIVYFLGKAKGLKLNLTMSREIARIAGSEDTDHWKGTVVQLFATTERFADQIHPVVRIKAPVARPTAVRREA